MVAFANLRKDKQTCRSLSEGVCLRDIFEPFARLNRNERKIRAGVFWGASAASTALRKLTVYSRFCKQANVWSEQVY